MKQYEDISDETTDTVKAIVWMQTFSLGIRGLNLAYYGRYPSGAAVWWMLTGH